MLVVIILVLILPSETLAHPGRTDANGGHTCRTNCEKWGLEYGEYHYHNGGGSSSGGSSSGTNTSTTKTTTSKPPPPVITYKNITVTEAISYETKREDDPNQEAGNENTKQAGKEGIKTITYKITFSGGKETDREKTGEEISQEAIEEIIAVGTKPAEEKKPAPAEENKSSGGSGLSSFIWLLILGGGGWWFYKKTKNKGDGESG